MKKSHLSVFLVIIGIFTQPVFCHIAYQSIQLEEVLSIGNLDDDLIFFLTSISVDDQGYIYISDSLDFSIKKFDKSGFLAIRSGGQGQGPGEFQFPVIVKSKNDNIYVVDQNRFGIQVFDSNLVYKTQIPFMAPIFDFEVDADNQIFVLSPSISEYPPVIRINEKGKTDINSLEKSSDSFFRSYGKFVLDGQGNLFFMSSFEDHVAKYDKNRKLIWKKALLDGKGAKFRYSDKSKISIPTEMVYKDIALDIHGNIFVLRGNLTKNPNRDVYVLDSQGVFLVQFTLQEPSHFIYFDRENYLYTRAADGISLKKYSLKYVQ